MNEINNQKVTLLYRNKITLLSFVLSVLVIIRHTVNIKVYSIDGKLIWYIEKIFASLSELAVPTFFSLSGYLFYVNFNKINLKAKLKSRFFSLIVTYIIWNTIAYLYFQLLKAIPFVNSHINQTLENFSLKSLLINAIYGNHNVTWFLRNLILYTYVTPILYPAIKNKKICIPFALLVFVISCLFIDDYSYLGNYIYYFFGCIMAIYFKEKIINYDYSILLKLVSLISLIAFSFAYAFITIDLYIYIYI